MIGIVIVAHGGLAREYLLALEHVVGKQSGIKSVAIGAECDREAKQAEIDAAVESVDTGDGVVIPFQSGGRSLQGRQPRCYLRHQSTAFGQTGESPPHEPERGRRPRRHRRSQVSGLHNKNYRITIRFTMTMILDIKNEKGLHARASAKFVEVVENFEADAEVSRDGTSASGDSIMGLLMLAAACGSQIEVKTSGPQAEELAAALKELVEGLFGEGK